MNECFFCGPTDNKLTEEHVWPIWVSKLLRGKYGSNHFVHVRSTGDKTTGLWRSPNLNVTTKTVCDQCNNVWLSRFENEDVKPLARPLIVGSEAVLLRPTDQWKVAAWAYKMTMLLEVANPDEPRRFLTPAERKQFRETTLAHERVRVFLANYKYGGHPAHAHSPVHTVTRREDTITFELKISTITAGFLGMQVMAVRSVASGELVSATSEMEFEFLGKAKKAIVPIWPPCPDAVRWPPPEALTQEDLEEWTLMWEKAENFNRASP